METTKNTEKNDYTCNISINGDKESIKPGETIEYEVSLSNIKANSGIKAFETYIDYDSNLFDCVVKSNEDENWSKIGFLEGYLTMYKNDGINTQDQVVAKIVFKAKSNISTSTNKITLKNIRFTSDDDKFFSVADISVDLKIN